MKFPSIARVSAELRRINTTVIDVCAEHGADCEDDCAAYIDVRLQVYPDGDWAVHSGLADYDTDHRGFWGSSSVPGNGRRFSSTDIARDLIGQAREAYAEECSAVDASTRKQATCSHANTRRVDLQGAEPITFIECSDCGKTLRTGRRRQCSGCVATMVAYVDGPVYCDTCTK